jgi:Ca-activated chloride channel family protein
MIEFLRPGWLLALPLGLALLFGWWRARAESGPWRRVVDAELLPHLAGRAPAASGRLALALGAAVVALGSLALAGPSWRSEPAPLYRDAAARIVVLDLSPSMNAVDVVPSRLERARAGVVSILRESAGAQLGLVVFAGDAFTVAPLMSDPGALVHLLASLDTRTVPRSGSRPDLGLEMALRLLERTGASGDAILVGDSAGDGRTLDAARALRVAGYPLSVLGVGAPHGGPVRRANGAFVQREDGEVLVVRPEFAALERVARAGGGRFHWLPPEGGVPHFARGREAWAEAPVAAETPSDLRKDDGAWLALLLLPFAALLFRRGWLVTVLLVFFLPTPQAHAFDWEDLWSRPDQQAAAGDTQALERLALDSPWRGILLYRGGRYAEAAGAFAQDDSADAHYNRGNALALAGRLEEALVSYGAALERSPSMRDALFNRALVREALARQKRGARGSAEAQSRRAAPDTRFAMRPEALAGGRGSQGDASRSEPQSEEERRSAWEDRADPKPAQEEKGEARPEEGPDSAEIRRLEALLAEVPDDPGSLLANRFRRQLQLRGTWNHDTGGRW